MFQGWPCMCLAIDINLQTWPTLLVQWKVACLEGECSMYGQKSWRYLLKISKNRYCREAITELSNSLWVGDCVYLASHEEWMGFIKAAPHWWTSCRTLLACIRHHHEHHRCNSTSLTVWCLSSCRQESQLLPGFCSTSTLITHHLSYHTSSHHVFFTLPYKPSTTTAALSRNALVKC